MFKKKDIIKLKDGYFYCIIANKELAIFAPCNKSGTKIKYKNMFALDPKAKTNGDLL